MTSTVETLLLVATVGSGLVAGLCFAFGSFILGAFNRLEAPQAIRAMQAINTRILRSSAMGVWFGTAMIGIVALALAQERAFVIAATVLYGFGAILVTGLGNVPLNEALDRVDPDAPGARDAWQRYHVRWGRWNVVRTVACALATAGFALAL